MSSYSMTEEGNLVLTELVAVPPRGETSPAIALPTGFASFLGQRYRTVEKT